jgi:hypothetical protein
MSGCSASTNDGNESIRLNSRHGTHSATLFRVPKTYVVKTLDDKGQIHGVALDIPYADIAQGSLAPRSEWKSLIAVTLDTTPWIRTPREIVADKLKQGHYRQEWHQVAYGMDKYWHEDVSGRPSNIGFYPINTGSEIKTIDCVGRGEPFELVGCTLHAEYQPGLMVDVTMPYGHMPESEAYWRRIKTMIARFVVREK